MAKHERFGKFVLLEDVGTSGLGVEYRAAKLGPSGVERLVSVLRLHPSLSRQPQMVKNLLEQVKFAAQIAGPNIVRVLGIGKTESAYYVSSEWLPGKSLREVLTRARATGLRLSVDHALLVASKVCAALEPAHARRVNEAVYFHGCVHPGLVLVAYEGEVRLRGFGVWPSQARGAGGLSEEEALYLAPEQLSGDGDFRSDIHGVGALLYEALSGTRLREGPGPPDVPARIAAARMRTTAGEEAPLPAPLVELLTRALAPSPADRPADIQVLRKAIDTLLFSGDFTPTTFNLAFYMHTLFGDQIDEEARRVDAEAKADYAREAEPPPTLIMEAPAEMSSPFLAPMATPPPLEAPPPTPPPSSRGSEIRSTESGAHRRVLTSPPPPEAALTPPAREPSLPGLASPVTTPSRRGPILAGAAAGVLVLAVAGYLWLRRGVAAPASPTPAPTVAALSPEAAAAEQRIQELETKLRAMESEKAAAEAQAAEETRRRLERQAAAAGRAVDPQALAQAQEEARRRARAEEERRQQDERRRLEEERQAQDARVAEEQRKAAEAQAVAAGETAASPAASPPPPSALPPATPTPTATPTAAPAPAAPVSVQPGALVTLDEPGVTPPVSQVAPQPVYPPIALRQGISGTVELRALVDENGNVADARVVTAAGGRAGLNEAALTAVKGRRYRPATKNAVPVKVWITVRVEFRLPG
jgi:serine/threonine-protein kinase